MDLDLNFSEASSAASNISINGNAINFSSASVIDVSSGVENEPGSKDKKKIKNFVKLTRMAYERKNDKKYL